MSNTPKHRILWADDEIDLLKPHVRFLEGKGYEVVAVLNGEDALSRVKSEYFDAVLLDEMMPGMGGIATLRAIKDLDPTIPVVLITKSEEELLMEEAIGRRIDDYLVKPVNPTQVFSTLKRLTEKTRIQHGAFTRDYVTEFNRLQSMRMGPLNQDEWPDLYHRVTDLELTPATTDHLQQHSGIERKSRQNAMLYHVHRKVIQTWHRGVY